MAIPIWNTSPATSVNAARYLRRRLPRTQYDYTMGASAGPRTPFVMAPAAKRSMIGGTTAALGKRSWDKDLLGEVLGDIMGDVDTTPLPGQRVGETNIGELSLLQQAGPEVGDISTSMDRFWKKKLGYA